MPEATEITSKLMEGLTRPRNRPLALEGRSGAGKTTLLRRLTQKAAPHTVWYSARDLADAMIAAVREDRCLAFRDSVADDPRPICIEHLEDLRGKPRTREEFTHLLGRAASKRPVILTLTRSQGDADVLSWLEGWTEVLTVG